MGKATAKQQTILLTAVNAIVRALGLCLRVWTSRLLGPEAMGIMEMAQSVHMVAIAPLTSGLPAAVSRLTAKSNKPEPILSAGLALVRKACLFLIPLFCLASPLAAMLMGDIRVLPSLWFSTPCIIILGYSAVCNGYCYGTGKSELPALSELIEQGLRFIFTVCLLKSLSKLSLPWLAAMPSAATVTAELIGLIFVLKFIPRIGVENGHDYNRQLMQLAVPVTLTRVLQTVMRSLNAIIIPLRLQATGLSAAESTAQLGMLNGMVGPFLVLPGIFTSALAMVTSPLVSKAENDPRRLKRLIFLMFCTSMPLAAIACAGLSLSAPWIANSLYRQAELTTLLRLSAPQMLLMPLNHMLGNTLSALGLQKRTLYASTIVSAVSLVLTWILAGNCNLRLTGVIYAQYIGQILSVLAGIALLITRNRGRMKLSPDDRCA